MDTQTQQFLIKFFKKELAEHERRVNGKFDDLKEELEAVDCKLSDIKSEIDGLKYFKAKVLGGSAVVSFLVTVLGMVLFNK